MIRYIGKYVCRDCKHEFIGADVEWNASSASYPVRCPECGSLNTRADYPSAIGDFVWSIWNRLKKH